MATLRGAQDSQMSREIQGDSLFPGRVERFADRVPGQNMVASRSDTESPSHRQTWRGSSDVRHQQTRTSAVSTARKAHCIGRSDRFPLADVEASSPSPPCRGDGSGPASYIEEDQGVYRKPAPPSRVLSSELFARLESGRKGLESPETSRVEEPSS